MNYNNITDDWKIKEAVTSDGRFKVRYAYPHDTLDKQLEFFEKNSLSRVSPAIALYLSLDANLAKDFCEMTSTNMDCVSIPETGDLVLIKNNIFTNIYSIKNIMRCHGMGGLFSLPNSEDTHTRNSLYKYIESLEKEKLALRIPSGTHNCDTKNFNEELSTFLFSDVQLGINSVNSGCKLSAQGHEYIQVHAQNQEYVKHFGLPRLTGVNIYNFPKGPFSLSCDYLPITGHNPVGQDLGNYGVHLEPIKNSKKI